MMKATTPNGASSSSSTTKRELSSGRTSSSQRFSSQSHSQPTSQSPSSRVNQPTTSPHVSSPILMPPSSPYSYSYSSPVSRSHHQIPLHIPSPLTMASFKQPLLDVTATASSPHAVRLGDHNFPVTGPTVAGTGLSYKNRKLFSSPSPVGQTSPAGTGCSCSCRESRRETRGIRELLVSLALMCLLSLMMALLALIFLQRTAPTVTLASDDDTTKLLRSTPTGVSSTRVTSINAKEFVRVSNFSVAMSTLTLSLNLCCLFVSCIQFLSAIKLLKTPGGRKRTHDFLKKTSHVRIISIGAFLISIPIFFTGIILFTFINFDEIPAVVTSIVIAIAIVFCGITAVQNVYLWQKEKTRASKELLAMNISRISHPILLNNNNISHLNNVSKLNQTQSAYFPPLELSTLV